MSDPVEGVDARTDRVAQGAVGILLLGAFVFGAPAVVAIVLVVLAAGALGGPRANLLHAAYARGVAPRLPGRVAAGDGEPVPVATVRAQDALGAAALAVAVIAFALGIGVVGWALTIAEAIVAIVAATTRVHLAERLRRGL